jgi:hypothetical protein
MFLPIIFIASTEKTTHFMTLLTIVNIEHGQEGSRLKLISYHYFSFEFKTKITSLTEEFLNPIEKSQIETKSILLTHKYMTAHFPGLMLLTHNYNVATSGSVI